MKFYPVRGRRLLRNWLAAKINNFTAAKQIKFFILPESLKIGGRQQKTTAVWVKGGEKDSWEGDIEVSRDKKVGADKQRAAGATSPQTGGALTPGTHRGKGVKGVPTSLGNAPQLPV